MVEPAEKVVAKGAMMVVMVVSEELELMEIIVLLDQA